MKDLSLYVHIPFCNSKCRYCSFVSFANRTEWIELYVKSLLAEVELCSEKIEAKKIRTIYLGGGTPSIVPKECVGRIINRLRDVFDVDEEAEITIEVNPDSVSGEKLHYYHRIGINRVSMGVQAMQPRLLRYLGRTHDFEKVKKAVRLIRQSEIENLNLDLIFGIPFQTKEDWEESLEAVMLLGPEHVACYSLELSEGSVLGSLHLKGKLEPMNEKLDRSMYDLAKKKLGDAGIYQYEISNFARTGKECKHNLLFWRGNDYLGIGASANSVVDRKRWKNSDNIQEYIKKISNGILPRDDQSDISRKEEISEEIMLGLRLIRGVNINELVRKYQIKNWDSEYGEVVRRLEIDGLIRSNLGNIVLTDKGMDLENQVVSEFI